MFLIPQSYWEIQKTKNRGRGVFAKKDILPGTVIGDYIGRVIKTAEEDIYEKDKQLYLMYYSDSATIYPIKRTPDIHLVNHSCTPNCWMYTYKGHTLYFALRHIFPGEEITIAYLVSPQDKYCSPCDHLCKCNGIICHQTMHLSEKRYNAWSKFHDAQEKKTKRERVKFGTILPLLKDYPKELPDDPIYDLFGARDFPPLLLQDTKVPSQSALRAHIRESGKTLEFPALNLRIHGVTENLLISGVIS